MTKGKEARMSKCPYCDTVMHADISCKCKCPHSIDPEIPICYDCISNEIKASKERKIADYEDRKATFTREYHDEYEEEMKKKRKSRIQQEWNQPEQAIQGYIGEI